MDNLSSLFESFNSYSSKELSTSSIEIKNRNSGYSDIMKELLKYFLRYNISNIQLEDTAKLLNAIPNGSVKLPTTKYLITKEFFENHTFECFKHVKCVKCKKYIKIFFFQ